MDARKSKRFIDLDELLDGVGSDRCGDGDSGFSVQPAEPQGSLGRADLQPGQGERERPSVRVEGGDGARGARQAHRAGNASGERRDVPAGSGGSIDHAGEKPGSGVLGLEGTFGSQLPDLSDGHWQAPEFPIAQVAEDGLRDEPAAVEDKPNERLTRLVGKSLRKLEQILDLDPTPWDEDYIKLLAMQKDAATSVIGMSIKADESRFRVQSESAIVAILQEVRALKQPSPPAIEVHAASS